MSISAGKIDELAFKGVVGTLFGLSIITAAIRTTYRLKTHGRLLCDDFVLIFACVTLTAATGLLYVMMPTIYWYEEIVLNPKADVLGTLGSVDELFAQTLRYRRLGYAYVSLTWTTIFSVKICFLLFFLQLVERLKRLMFIWKIVFAITLVVYGFCVCGTFIACPHIGHNDALTCMSGYPITLNLILSFTHITLDIFTDLLIIMIPAILLWNVKIKLSQKLLLGVFLCLSICMIISALIRISGLHLSSTTINVQWELFFQQVEASVSVITVSITAFRSLLGLKALKSREKKERAWYSYRRLALLKKNRQAPEFDPNRNQLPSIPRATLTGMRTFIRGNRDVENDEEADIMGSRDGGTKHYVRVTQEISSESEPVRSSIRNLMIKPMTHAETPDIEKRLITLPKSLNGAKGMETVGG